MIEYSIIAGQAAIDALGYDDALLHFKRAHEARREDVMDDQLANISVGLARAEISATGDIDVIRTGIGHASIAFDYFAGVGEIGKALDVAAIPMATIFDEEAIELTRKAVAIVDDNAPTASFLLSRYSLQVANGGEFETAWNYSDRSLQLARSREDFASEAWAQFRRGTRECQRLDPMR